MRMGERRALRATGETSVRWKGELYPILFDKLAGMNEDYPQRPYFFFAGRYFFSAEATVT